MGIYLNPSNANLLEDLKKELYIDKSMMIREINHFIDTGNQYVCVSRARRFGKTMAGNMLSAYYSKGCDSREEFSRLKISKDPCFEEKLNKYNVIMFDMNSEFENAENEETLLSFLTEEIKAELREQFPNVTLSNGDNLAKSILKIYNQTGETFIIIIDEYDVLVREDVSENLFKTYLKFLNGLFKSNTVRPAISLAYLTGILPIVRQKTQSKLNNFEEYTMLNARELSEYVGFTEDEVRMLCSERKMDFAECKSWYDGYRQNGYEIYNPRSVIKAMSDKEYGSYWNQTSTYTVIADRLSANFDGMRDSVIQMLSGEDVPVRVTTYMNTMTDFMSLDDAFTYLIHIGYLAYDDDKKTCRIPNREIWQEWETAVRVLDDYSETNKIIHSSKELLESTLSGDEQAVAKALDESHIHVTSNRSYNNEDALQSAIYLAYLYALNHYTIVREMTAGKGFSDVTFIPVKNDRPALIIELKRNGSANSAVNQIREKKYFD